MMHDQADSGPWQEGQAVEVRFPLRSTEPPSGPATDEQMAILRAERESWPWLAGEIESQCGPDEWAVIVCDDRLATTEDGSPAPEGTPDDEVFWPRCFRDSSEIREPQPEAEVDREAGQ